MSYAMNAESELTATFRVVIASARVLRRGSRPIKYQNRQLRSFHAVHVARDYHPGFVFNY